MPRQTLGTPDSHYTASEEGLLSRCCQIPSSSFFFFFFLTQLSFCCFIKKNATYLVSLTLSFFFKFFFFSRSFDFKRLSGFKEVFKSAAVTRGSPSLFVCQLLCVAAPSGARGDCVTSNRCIPGDTSTSDSVIATNPFRRVHIFIYKPSAVALQNWTGNI